MTLASVKAALLVQTTLWVGIMTLPVHGLAGACDRNVDFAKVSAAAVAMQNTAAAGGYKEAIPSRFWPKSVRALSPIAIYSDRVNIAIVLERTKKQECGLYVFTPFSSYFPVSGDGWSFQHIDHGIYRYICTNKISN